MDNKKMYIMTYDHGGFVLWQEKVARQLKQAIEWLEKYPDFKIGLDYEAFTFDEMAKTAPEIMEMIAESLKKYPGRFGLGSTTYGQPLSLFISEESNVRQLTYAIRSNIKECKPVGILIGNHIVCSIQLLNNTVIITFCTCPSCAPIVV